MEVGERSYSALPWVVAGGLVLSASFLLYKGGKFFYRESQRPLTEHQQLINHPFPINQRIPERLPGGSFMLSYKLNGETLSFYACSWIYPDRCNEYHFPSKEKDVKLPRVKLSSNHSVDFCLQIDSVDQSRLEATVVDCSRQQKV